MVPSSLDSTTPHGMGPRTKVSGISFETRQCSHRSATQALGLGLVRVRQRRNGGESLLLGVYGRGEYCGGSGSSSPARRAAEAHTLRDVARRSESMLHSQDQESGKRLKRPRASGPIQGVRIRINYQLGTSSNRRLEPRSLMLDSRGTVRWAGQPSVIFDQYNAKVSPLPPYCLSSPLDLSRPGLLTPVNRLPALPFRERERGASGSCRPRIRFAGTKQYISSHPEHATYLSRQLPLIIKS